MDYKELISNAIEKNEVVKLLRGEGEYEIVVSEFVSDVFPTDVNSVLVNCFYKQNDNIKDIEKIFNNALNDLIKGNASDVYIAVLYFDTCIFQEEKGKASFLIDKEGVSKKLQEKIHKVENKLRESVEFENGMKKRVMNRFIEKNRMIEYDDKPIGIIQYQLINEENKELYNEVNENAYRDLYKSWDSMVDDAYYLYKDLIEQKSKKQKNNR